MISNTVGFIIKKERNTTKFYYKGKFYEISNFEEFVEQHNDCYFIKEYPWNYEKEFRIVIIDKQKRNFDRILLPFPEEIAKQMKLKTGKNCVADYAKLPISKKQSSKSTLNIKMNLLKKNKYEVLAYIADKLLNT